MAVEVISQSISMKVYGNAVFLAWIIFLEVTKCIFLPNYIEIGPVESNKKTFKVFNIDI